MLWGQHVVLSRAAEAPGIPFALVAILVFRVKQNFSLLKFLLARLSMVSSFLSGQQKNYSYFIYLLCQSYF